MKHTKHILLCALLLAVSGAYAEKKTFTKEYTYHAGEDDSRNTSRTNATAQMRSILLREIGTFILAEQQITTLGNEQDYSEKIEAITAGIVTMNIIEEKFDPYPDYYIKAEMTIDPDDVNKRIDEVLNDKQKTKDLEDSRQRVLAADAEIAKLKREMEEQRRQFAEEKDAAKRALEEERNKALQASYQKQVNILSTEEYVISGNNAYENGLYASAIDAYQKAIEIDSNYAGVAYNNIGAAYNALKNYTQAISSYQKVIDIEPQSKDAHYNMGVGYFALKNYPQAIRCYQKAIDIDPNFKEAHCNMGESYREQKDYAQAISCYKKAIAIDPNFAMVYGNMAVAYQAQGNGAETIKCLQKAAQLGNTAVQEILRKSGYSW
jgi:superkiller protein 3